MKKEPDSVNLDGHSLAMLDQKAAGGKEGTAKGKGNQVVLCRIGDKNLQGDRVHCVLYPADESPLELGGTAYGTFDELLEGLGGVCARDLDCGRGARAWSRRGWAGRVQGEKQRADVMRVISLRILTAERCAIYLEPAD